MPDPIGARRSYREFTKTAGNELPTRREIAVEPQPGRLVMFESWLPHYVQENRHYLTVAIGCTGGQHRSVYLVEALARRFAPTERVLVRHRALAGRSQAATASQTL